MNIQQQQPEFKQQRDLIASNKQVTNLQFNHF